MVPARQEQTPHANAAPVVIEVTDVYGLTVAECRCRHQSVILDAPGPLGAELMRAALLGLVEHARRCDSGHRDRVGRLLAERFPKVP